MGYLLKASGLVLILFIFYYVFLKNETFFKSIRSYFIAGLLIVLTIPLIKIPIYVEAVSSQLNLIDYKELTTSDIAVQTINCTQIISFIYLIGVVFFSIKFLIQLISLGNLVSKHQLTKQGNYYLAETTKNISPFSFFNIIIYNKSKFSIEELEQIINHEKVHVQQWHSIDTLLAHLLVITLWFNPFVWLYKKAVQQNLEFLADAQALEKANNHKLYQFTLLKTCGANYCTEITNNFYNSLIKKRIIMLHKKKSTSKNQWKYALLLPLLIAFLFAFNTKVVAQKKKLVEIEDINNVKVELLINKNSTDEILKKESGIFKKQFDITLSFKGIKRNATNEITTIKIDAKGTDLRAKFENSGTEAIKPIKISFDNENNNLSIGNVSKSKKMELHEIHKMANKHYLKKNNSKETHYTVTTTYSDEENLNKKDTFYTKENKLIWHKNKDNHIEVEVISEEGDNEHVWFHEKDKNKNIKVEVIELKEGEHKITVIQEGNEDEIKVNEEGENVFIIKSKEGNKEKHKIIIKGTSVFDSSESESPLIIFDGKEISDEELKKLDINTVEKMEVLKGKSATNKYGNKAKGGVILITTKKQ